MLFTGRLTANAAATAVNEDKQVINFTVAINQKWKNKAGEKKEKTAFVDCAYWRNSGIAEYLTKGAVVEIAGWIEAQGYQSKKDGIRARLTCTCDTFLSVKSCRRYRQHREKSRNRRGRRKGRRRPKMLSKPIINKFQKT